MNKRPKVVLFVQCLHCIDFIRTAEISPGSYYHILDVFWLSQSVYNALKVEQKRRTEESPSRWIDLITMAMLEGLKGQAADTAFWGRFICVASKIDTHLVAQNSSIYHLANLSRLYEYIVEKLVSLQRVRSKLKCLSGRRKKRKEQMHGRLLNAVPTTSTPM